jgi:hypothetical protein
MFYDFSHRHISCLVDGAADHVILSRDTRATTIIGKEYLYNGLFAPDSPVQNGSMVEVGPDAHLVQTTRRTTERDKYCSLIKTNAVIDVQRYGRQYDASDNPLPDINFAPVASSVIAFVQLITAQLRQDEPGLLPTTVYIMQLQLSAGVKSPKDGLRSPDRVVLNGLPYQVDVVDAVKYPNLLFVQLSEDTR